MLGCKLKPINSCQSEAGAGANVGLISILFACTRKFLGLRTWFLAKITSQQNFKFLRLPWKIYTIEGCVNTSLSARIGMNQLKFLELAVMHRLVFELIEYFNQANDFDSQQRKFLNEASTRWNPSFLS